MEGTHINTRKNAAHRYPCQTDRGQGCVQDRITIVRRDLPASLFHLQLIVNDISNWKAKFQVVEVFHTNADHVTLHDQASNSDRNIATDNPYKKIVTDLMERGVQVELCGATAKAHGWGNADIIPGIKINTDAMARIKQLVQEGFVKISES